MYRVRIYYYVLIGVLLNTHWEIGNVFRLKLKCIISFYFKLHSLPEGIVSGVEVDSECYSDSGWDFSIVQIIHIIIGNDGTVCCSKRVIEEVLRILHSGAT